MKDVLDIVDHKILSQLINSTSVLQMYNTQFIYICIYLYTYIYKSLELFQ